MPRHGSRGARFCSECGAPVGPSSVGPERKVITALFCDLVDSTALGERLDAEEIDGSCVATRRSRGGGSGQTAGPSRSSSVMPSSASSGSRLPTRTIPHARLRRREASSRTSTTRGSGSKCESGSTPVRRSCTRGSTQRQGEESPQVTASTLPHGSRRSPLRWGSWSATGPATALVRSLQRRRPRTRRGSPRGFASGTSSASRGRVPPRTRRSWVAPTNSPASGPPSTVSTSGTAASF